MRIIISAQSYYFFLNYARNVTIFYQEIVIFFIKIKGLVVLFGRNGVLFASDGQYVYS